MVNLIMLQSMRLCFNRTQSRLRLPTFLPFLRISFSFAIFHSLPSSFPRIPSVRGGRMTKKRRREKKQDAERNPAGRRLVTRPKHTKENEGRTCTDTFIPASITALTGVDSFLVLTCATCIYTPRSSRFLQIAAMGERDCERPLRLSTTQYQLQIYNGKRVNILFPFGSIVYVNVISKFKRISTGVAIFPI